MPNICTCPKCGSQLELKFASGPRSSQQSAPSDLGELLDSINMETLSGAELDFVQKTKERFAQYGKTTRMSEKQLVWLNDIASKGF